MGYVNGIATPPTFTDLGGHVKDITVVRDPVSPFYTISWATPHPKSTAYVINLTALSNGATPRIRFYPGTATEVQIIVCRDTGGFTTGNFMITIFK